jgi:argininosuccinate lyase
MADWLTRWTKAKAPLKKFTSTSKPAGLDKAFAAFDTATRKNDAAAVIKAGVLVEKAAADYVKTLKNVLKEPKEAEDYKTAVKALEANIQTILNRLRLTVKSAQGG